MGDLRAARRYIQAFGQQISHCQHRGPVRRKRLGSMELFLQVIKLSDRRVRATLPVRLVTILMMNRFLEMT